MSRPFLRLWFGQSASLLGSTIASFAVSLWVFQKTGRALDLSLLIFARFVPFVLVSHLAGKIVDLRDKKRILLWSDAVLAGLALMLFLFLFSGQFSITVLMILLFFNGLVESLQTLALQITPTLFLEKSLYSKANGFISLSENFPKIAGPLLAPLLLHWCQLEILIGVDVVTYVVAMAVTATVDFPRPKLVQKRSAASAQTAASFLKGLRQIKENPQLFHLIVYFAGCNFVNGIASGLIAAFVLEITRQSATALGLVNSFGAIGLVLGGVVCSTCQLKGDYVKWIVAGALIAGLFGRVIFSQITLMLGFAVVILIRNLSISIVGTANQSLWQASVPLKDQGTIFGIRRILAQGLYPLGLLAGGALTVFPFSDTGIARFFSLPLTPGLGLRTLFLICGLIEIGLALQLGLFAFSTERHRTSDHRLALASAERVLSKPTE